jgi:hypothetical protein
MSLRAALRAPFIAQCVAAVLDLSASAVAQLKDDEGKDQDRGDAVLEAWVALEDQAAIAAAAQPAFRSSAASTWV